MSRPRILVVDDSATVLNIVEAALAEYFEVATAADGIEALEKARRSPPDVIVTDSIMPGLDGLALLRALKDVPATRRIPVIILTSEDAGNVASPRDDVQPAAVVTKSMDLSALLSAIRSVLTAR